MVAKQLKTVTERLKVIIFCYFPFSIYSTLVRALAQYTFNGFCIYNSITIDLRENRFRFRSAERRKRDFLKTFYIITYIIVKLNNSTAIIFSKNTHIA